MTREDAAVSASTCRGGSAVLHTIIMYLCPEQELAAAAGRCGALEWRQLRAEWSGRFDVKEKSQLKADFCLTL